mmetsp:Transcript_1506/g.5143  ORF Transcript_1506/g.5143 Transcript_1506/m.5143 type:complete len:235 (+) Transcript_1506:2249-2953(+)
MNIPVCIVEVVKDKNATIEVKHLRDGFRKVRCHVHEFMLVRIKGVQNLLCQNGKKHGLSLEDFEEFCSELSGDALLASETHEIVIEKGFVWGAWKALSTKGVDNQFDPLLIESFHIHILPHELLPIDRHEKHRLELSSKVQELLCNQLGQQIEQSCLATFSWTSYKCLWFHTVIQRDLVMKIFSDHVLHFVVDDVYEAQLLIGHILWANATIEHLSHNHIIPSIHVNRCCVPGL